jgi:hypothetical protein
VPAAIRRAADGGSIPAASTIFPRWNPLSIRGALDRGRLLACRDVCGAVLATPRSGRDADVSPSFGPDFGPKTAFRLSPSLFDADLRDSSASIEEFENRVL